MPFSLRRMDNGIHFGFSISKFLGLKASSYEFKRKVGFILVCNLFGTS